MRCMKHCGGAYSSSKIFITENVYFENMVYWTHIASTIRLIV